MGILSGLAKSAEHPSNPKGSQLDSICAGLTKDLACHKLGVLSIYNHPEVDGIRAM